jgi:hypothetical protein
MVGMHEQCPNVSCVPVTNGECYNCAVYLDHPAAPGCFDGGNVVHFSNGGTREGVFPHCQADAMHIRNVSAIGLPQYSEHVVAP